ncbi:MAG: hypothetical protein HC876_12540 [Chloroflexaceae bacterium]|nr:hypothetical protein [Chloroflexaceae bacterium]
MKQTCIRLAPTELWVVAAALALSVLTPRALPLALGVAALFWLVRWVAYGRPSIAAPAAVHAPVLLLIALIPMTLWATSEPDITRTQVYRLLSGIALLYAMVNWATTRQRIQTLVTGIITLGWELRCLPPSVLSGKDQDCHFCRPISTPLCPDCSHLPSMPTLWPGC